MTRYWLLTIRTRLRCGAEKTSRSAMLCSEPIDYPEALEIATSQFVAHCAIEITEVNYERV